MGNVAIANVWAYGQLRKVPNAKVDGAQCTILVGTITMASSYATNGDTLDLSGYFTQIHDVAVCNELNALHLSYVRATAGAAATGKIKAVNALPAHTHAASIPVTGGQAAASTKAVYVAALAAVKEEAGNTTLDYTVPNNTVAIPSSEAANTSNLSTYTATIIVMGVAA